MSSLPGLQKFLTLKSEGAIKRDVDMVQCITEWKAAHSNQRPIIVVRLRELLLTIIQKNVQWAALGGRHQIYYHELDALFGPLKAAGAELVFFGGATKADDAGEEHKKRSAQMSYDRTKNVLEQIDRGDFKRVLADHHYFRSQLGMYVKAVADKYGEFKCRAENECFNKSIVEYARRNKRVLAIMARENEFMAFDLGHAKYWICGEPEVDISSGTVAVFDQAKALAAINLSHRQFLLAISMVSIVHKKEYENARMRLDAAVTKTAPEISWNMARYAYAFERIATLTGSIAVDEAVTAFFGHNSSYVAVIEKYLQRLVSNDRAIDASAAELTAESDLRSKIIENHALYSMWRRAGITDMNKQMVDLRPWNSPQAKLYPDLFIAVHRRAIGVLLNRERNYECEVVRKFAYQMTYESKTEIIQVDIEFPPAYLETPDIVDLMRMDVAVGTHADQLIDIKWNNFLWIIDVAPRSGPLVKLRRLPIDILPAIVTTMFLVKEHQITESDAFLLIKSENDVLQHRCDDKYIDLPVHIDPRVIRVANLYVHARVFINRSLMICGIELHKVPVMFDGVHFHNLMDQQTDDSSSCLQLYDERSDRCTPFEIADILDDFHLNAESQFTY